MSGEDRNWRIERKIDTILEKVNALEIAMATKTASDSAHQERVEQLEKDMAPVKRHVFMVQGGFKLVGFLGILAGVVEAIMLATGARK